MWLDNRSEHDVDERWSKIPEYKKITKFSNQNTNKRHKLNTTDSEINYAKAKHGLDTRTPNDLLIFFVLRIFCER